VGQWPKLNKERVYHTNDQKSRQNERKYEMNQKTNKQTNKQKYDIGINYKKRRTRKT
jgi:hypothetical protein